MVTFWPADVVRVKLEVDRLLTVPDDPLRPVPTGRWIPRRRIRDRQQRSHCWPRLDCCWPRLCCCWRLR
jgi:hypothetical protein